jgi:hypothetical protein
VLGGDRDAGFAASRPLLRSAGFAAVAVPVTLAGHDAAGGHHPDTASLLLALALTTVGHRLVLAPRERSAVTLATALGLAQLGLHLLFGGREPSGQMTGQMTHQMTHQMAGPMGQATAHGAAMSPILMIVAHGGAAVVLGWFLRQGERALWTAARRAVRSARTLAHRIGPAVLAALLLADLLPVTGPAGGRTAPADPHPSLRQRLRATGGRFRRGPPSCVVLAG